MIGGFAIGPFAIEDEEEVLEAAEEVVEGGIVVVLDSEYDGVIDKHADAAFTVYITGGLSRRIYAGRRYSLTGKW